MNIPSWKGTYYSDINVQSIDKQNAYKKLKEMWDKQEYMRISSADNPNTAYFITYFYEVIKDFVHHPQKYNILKNKLQFIIDEYKNDQTNALDYGIRWLNDMAWIMKDFDTISSNAEKYLNNKTYWIRGEFPREAFGFLNIEDSSIVDVKYFKYIFKTYSYLTEYGKYYREEIEHEIDKELEKLCIRKKTNFIYLLMEVNIVKTNRFIGVPDIPFKFGREYDKKIFNMKKQYKSILKELTRNAEDTVRSRHSVPRVGEAWVSETLLYKKLCDSFVSEKIIQHAQPNFLGQQHYDIYFPEHKIAIEYHGIQHFEPVDFFGGKDAYEKNVERDSRKKKISSLNKVHLIVLREGYIFNDLLNEIATQIKKKSNVEVVPNYLNYNEKLEEDIKEKRKNYASKIAELKSTIKVPELISDEYKILINRDCSTFINYINILCFQLLNDKYFLLESLDTAQYYEEFVQKAKTEKNKFDYEFIMNSYEKYTQGECRYIKNDEIINDFENLNMNWLQPVRMAFELFYKYYEQRKLYEEAVKVIKEQLKLLFETNNTFEREIRDELNEKIVKINDEIFSENKNSELQEVYMQMSKNFNDSLSDLNRGTKELRSLENVFTKGSLLIHFEVKHIVELEIVSEKIYKDWLRLENVMKLIISEKTVNLLISEEKKCNQQTKDWIVQDPKLRSNNNKINVGQLATKVLISFNKLKDFERAYEIACFGEEEGLTCYSGKSFQERRERLKIKISNN